MSTNEETSNQTDIEIISEKSIKLPPKINRFIQIYLTGIHSTPEIARMLGVHPNSIRYWMKNPKVREIIDDTQRYNHEAVSNQVKNLTLKAVRKLDDLIDSPIDGVALQAVNTVLDRGGHKVKNEININKTITTIEEKFKSLIDMSLSDVPEGAYIEIIEEKDSYADEEMEDAEDNTDD